MTNLGFVVFLFVAVALLPVDSVRAHHSFATHYLMDQSMEITGVVTEASLRNPHSFFTLEVMTDGPQPVLFHEYQGLARPLSFTEEPADAPPGFGRRTATIEGDALVIESVGFSEHPAGLASDWDRIGRGRNVPGSAQKRLVERYTVSDDRTTLVLDYTLEDAVYLSEPFTARIEWIRLKDDAPIYEFDCDADVATRSTLNAVPL